MTDNSITPNSPIRNQMFTEKDETIEDSQSVQEEKQERKPDFIMCQDHSTRYREVHLADRYCLLCKYPLCSSCIVDHHSTHVSQAKTKIKDFLADKKIEVDDLMTFSFSAQDQRKVISGIYDMIELNNEFIDKDMEERKKYLEDLKNKIDKIIYYEQAIAREFKEKSKNIYQDLYRDKLNHLITQSNKNSNDISKFVEDWSNMSQAEQMNIVKESSIPKIKQSSQNLKDNLQMESELVKGKILNLIDYIKKFKSDLKQNVSFSGIDIELRNITNQLKTKYEYLEKCDLEKVSKESNLKNFANFNPSQNNIYSSQLFNLENDDFTLKTLAEKNSFNVNKSDFNLNNRTARNLSMNDLNVDKLFKNKDVLNNGFNLANRKNHEFVIAIRPNSKQIKFFDGENKMSFESLLENKIFHDMDSFIEKFPNHCRYINLGLSLLISGGIFEDGSTIANCFLIVICKKNTQNFKNTVNDYEISVLPYSQMLEGRERHCLINLEDKKKVLACSGFTKRSAEITNINSGTWKKIADLNEIRANASIAYINEQYVWVFGGFQINQQKNGVYLNSAEVFNSNNENSFWNLIDFEGRFRNIRITACGIVNYKEEQILICGGYDGQVYNKEVLLADFNCGILKSVIKSEFELSEENIFFASSFVRCGEIALNYDYKLDLNIFNPTSKEFSITK